MPHLSASVQSLEEAIEIRIHGAPLGACLQRVAFAAGPYEPANLPDIVAVEIAHGKLRLTGTDGHCLASLEMPCETTEDIKIGLKTTQVRRSIKFLLARGGDAVLRVSSSVAQVVANRRGPRMDLSIEPPTQPPIHEHEVVATATYDIDQLGSEIITTVMDTADPNAHIRLGLGPEGASASLLDDSGADVVKGAYLHGEGKSIEVGINAQYLLQALDQVSGPQVTLQAGGPESPIHLIDAEWPQWTCVIMPMTLPERGTDQLTSDETTTATQDVERTVSRLFGKSLTEIKLGSPMFASTASYTGKMAQTLAEATNLDELQRLRRKVNAALVEQKERKEATEARFAIPAAVVVIAILTVGAVLIATESFGPITFITGVIEDILGRLAPDLWRSGLADRLSGIVVAGLVLIAVAAVASYILRFIWGMVESDFESAEDKLELIRDIITKAETQVAD